MNNTLIEKSSNNNLYFSEMVSRLLTITNIEPSNENIEKLKKQLDLDKEENKNN